MCLIAWPLNESETEVNLVLIRNLTAFFFPTNNKTMRTAKKYKKSREVFTKTRSTPASRSFKGQAIKHTTVKWSVVPKLKQVFIVSVKGRSLN